VPIPSVPSTKRERRLRVDFARPPSPRGMATICAKETESTYCRPSGPRPWTPDWKRKRTHRVRRGRREVRPWPYLPTALNPLRAVLIVPGAGEKTGGAKDSEQVDARCTIGRGRQKAGFSVRSDSERPRDRDCSATRVALEAGRTNGENDTKRKVAQGSISATTSAAAYRRQNIAT
jgi:hypothetical protein